MDEDEEEEEGVKGKADDGEDDGEDGIEDSVMRRSGRITPLLPSLKKTYSAGKKTWSKVA